MSSPGSSKRGLRYGFSTGACAAAAAFGAARLLQSQKCIEQVSLELPAGFSAEFPLHGQDWDAHRARCFVVKDAGDDPDVTHGVEVHADLAWDESLPGEVELCAGPGVGRVTLPGLAVAVGAPAINPVPRRMILAAIRSVFPQLVDDRGLRVTFSIPDGEQRAERTLNARLGIVGGLSLLGTTGVVTPLSHRAWTDTLDTALDVAKACDCDTVVGSTGRTSERAVQQRLSLADEAFVLMGDYVAYFLQACASRGFSRVLLSVQFAKLVKIAAGHAQTHVRSSRLELATLAGWGSDCGLDPVVVERIELANTAREVFGLPGVQQLLLPLVAERALAIMRQSLPGVATEILVCDYDGASRWRFGERPEHGSGEGGA
ncbi:MAG: cobalt-precorrin-5B (C(1))-methyltransferase [Desulfuromonas sp.]|nr:MAG: cobalt-precorrin-5B (C(1))-methyltransferase [Desulfuromonas sp.]